MKFAVRGLNSPVAAFAPKEMKAYCQGRLDAYNGNLTNPYPANIEEGNNLAWQAGQDEFGSTVGSQVGCANVPGEETNPALLWLGPIPDQTAFSQGDPWTLNLRDYVADQTATFVIVTGSPPTGITLNPDGTFSGTITNISGQGSVSFEFTTGAGTSPVSNQMFYSYQ